MVETICRELLLVVLWLKYSVPPPPLPPGVVPLSAEYTVVDLLVNNNIETGNNRQAKEIIIIS